ncbi:MAG TPA: polyphenol oxidase family protein [Planctomycetota bacterium]|nr:polyphenol oxidase family protein [Planctomycetota bacterium]
MRRVESGGVGLLVFEGLQAPGFRCAHSTAPLDVARADDRRRLVAAAGLSPDRVASPVQVHGTDVVRVDAPPSGDLRADGLVTDARGLALLVKAADCSLVVVADPVRRAVGVAHAGWRGAAGGIARNLVAALRREYGSDPGDLVAGVGPTIGVARYAVGAEVLEAFRARASWADEYARTVDGRLHYDVAGANARGLHGCGVRAVEVAGICTHESKDLLFSYRRQGPGAGHHGLVAGWL